ncbi:MAG TPA: PAS domain S-box protein [Ktedonobacteraceae bacterium]|nr:PAS domain S-box protein [Ktedonobacteraceae bacterium]
MVQDGSLQRTNQETTEITHSFQVNKDLRQQLEQSSVDDIYFKQIVDSIEDRAIFTTDRGNNINSWGVGAARVYGYSGIEMLAQNVAILFPSETQNEQQLAEDLQAAIERGSVKGEKWYRRKNGTTFLGGSSIFLLKDKENNIRGFTHIIYDSTDKKRFQEERETLIQELKAEKQKLVNIFERGPAFMAILQGEQHVFEMANTAYFQLVGQRDLIGKPVAEALPEVVDQGVLELLDSVYTTGQPFIGTERSVGLQREAGGALEERYLNYVYEPLINAQDERIGIIAHGYDVTDQVVARKNAEQLALQIEQQAQAFNVTLSALQDFVYTFDVDGRFTYANSPLLELLGLTLDQIVGKNFHQLPYPEELATTLHSQIKQVVRTGQTVTDETSYTNPTGNKGYYEYIFTPIFDSNQRVTLVAGSTRDITTRQQLESQKDEFMGIVSHELKTPVTSIKAFTQVLQSRFERAGDERSSALLGKMDAQINKLTSLISDLLDVTKIEGGQLQFNQDYFSFDELVTEVVEETQRTTNNHTINITENPHMIVFGDRDRIGQVISNMLTNAIKYSPNAEQVIVTTSVNHESVTLCVQDFGVGIPQERQHQIFERYYRVSGNDTISGIGLGLYISAEIIKRQNGKIWVESEQGKGSKFCFSLPIPA